MSDLPNPSTPARRAADADREATAQRVRDAAAEGRLDFAELEERLGAVYSAKTLVELQAITADLGVVEATEVAPLNLQTRSGTLKKRGYWRVPSRIVVECTSGSIKLDFTQADCPHRQVTIDATVKSGTVKLIVPNGWAVDLDQATTTSGVVVNRVRERPAPGAPVLRVRGKVQSGVIKARHPRRGFWAWLTGKRRPSLEA